MGRPKAEKDVARRKAFYAEWDAGKALRRRGQNKAALAHYLKAIEQFDRKAFDAKGAKSDLCDLWSDIAAVRSRMRDLRGALKAIDRSLTYRSGYGPTPLYNKGVILSKLRRHRDAISWYDHAIANVRSLYLHPPPIVGEYLSAKAESLEALGRTDDAVANYEYALAVAKAGPVRTFIKARLKALTGKVPRGLVRAWPRRR
jgi:tetratricopeptide (TPR) repeat protein